MFSQFCAGDPIPADQLDLRSNPEYTPGQCPANDIEILAAMLDTGNECNTCEPGTVITANLKITINHGTNSNNRYLGVFADLREVSTSGVTTNCDIARCSGPVAKSSDQVNSMQVLDFGRVTFTCGSTLSLRNILLVWTAANGECPVTPANNPNGKYCYANPTIQITPPLNGRLEASCGSNNTANINLTVRGGSGDFSYLWSNSATTQDLTGVSLGSYTVTVTDNVNKDASGDPCQIVKSITFNGPCCQPPNISCPPTATVECGDSTAPSDTGNPSSTDGCGDVDFTFSDSSVAGCGNTETISRTWTATDEDNNTDQCVQTINVVDTTPPVLSGQGPDGTFPCGGSPTFPTPTASDACGSVIITFEDTNGTVPSCAGLMITRTWTATDACGNKAFVSQTMTPVDDTAPTLVGVPGDSAASCDNIPAPANVTATDDCDPSPSVSMEETTIPGNCPNNYILIRTWTAKDECGNEVSASQNIAVSDNTAPVPPAPPIDLKLECATDVPPPVDLTAVDNCDGDITVSPTANITPGACLNDFVMVRTWTFTDQCGNFSSVSQTITVLDTIAPVLPSAPADLALECATDVPPPTDLTAVDNCDGDITVSPNISVTPGGCPNSFTEVRTWTFSDTCGNTSSISQTITVLDTIAPVLPSAPADLNLECASDVPPPSL